MPDINFHVVGGTDEMVVHWRNYAKSKNIYFYGYKNPNMIPWYLQSFDVVLAPLQLQKTKRRPFGKNMSPLKIPQYFANQCAIVASNVPAHMEMLEDQKNAIICEPDDINKWTESINLLRKDQSLRNIIRKTAFKNYLSEYTPSVRLEKILYNIECQ